MTTGYGMYGGGDYVTTAYASDGSSVIAYLPTTRSVTIDPSVLAGDSIRVFWFNPGNGVVTDEGAFSKASRAYSPPAPGDWVLVVDGNDHDGEFDVPGGDPPAVATSVAETPSPRPLARLDQNHPNPFNPTTTITYEIVADTRLSLEVFDAAGRRVRTLYSGVQSAGRHSTPWDGRDDGGRTVASGIYFYRLRAGEVCLTKKMLLVK
jgi:hypothetical protein